LKFHLLVSTFSSLPLLLPRDAASGDDYQNCSLKVQSGLSSGVATSLRRVERNIKRRRIGYRPKTTILFIKISITSFFTFLSFPFIFLLSPAVRPGAHLFREGEKNAVIEPGRSKRRKEAGLAPN
jgi:hypothetical protein